MPPSPPLPQEATGILLAPRGGGLRLLISLASAASVGTQSALRGWGGGWGGVPGGSQVLGIQPGQLGGLIGNLLF